MGYPPKSVGGTEVYVQALTRELSLQGHRVTVVVPSENENTESDELADARQMSLADFNDFISGSRFDVVHGHPLFTSQFLSHLQICRQKGIPIIITYHTPTLSCGRGDLLLYGKRPCDGEVLQRRCTACILQQKGLPVAIGHVLALLPVFDALKNILPIGKLHSMISIPAQVHQNRESLQQLLALTSHWVAVSKWAKKVIEINSGDADIISVHRQAYCYELASSIVKPAFEIGSMERRLRIGFLGRIHPYKGLHVLLQALHYLPSEKFEVCIAGDKSTIAPGYKQKLEIDLRGDPRVKWFGKIEPGLVPDFLAKMDVLVVPSVWLETGPMTVLEAWANGVPIIGSARGGIEEWVHEYGGGLLFPAGNSRALALIIKGLVNKNLEFPPVPVDEKLFSMKIVARTMTKLYKHEVRQKDALDVAD
ncbi:glycosyltransferase [Gammaproteobacteria bacterium]|nr:glycosyltransferase [Gammaproteobacteria bacterium]